MTQQKQHVSVKRRYYAAIAVQPSNYQLSRHYSLEDLLNFYGDNDDDVIKA